MSQNGTFSQSGSCGKVWAQTKIEPQGSELANITVLPPHGRSCRADFPRRRTASRGRRPLPDDSKGDSARRRTQTPLCVHGRFGVARRTTNYANRERAAG